MGILIDFSIVIGSFITLLLLIVVLRDCIGYMLETIKHIYKEDSKGKVKRYGGVGNLYRLISKFTRN